MFASRDTLIYIEVHGWTYSYVVVFVSNQVVAPTCLALGVNVIKVGGLCKKMLVAMHNEISALVGFDGEYVSWYSIPFVIHH